MGKKIKIILIKNKNLNYHHYMQCHNRKVIIHNNNNYENLG